VITVAVTGAGGAAACNFIESLRMSDVDFFIVGLDASADMLRHAPVDDRVLIPRCDEPRWWDTIVETCKHYDVDLIHAQPDQEVLRLAAAQSAGIMPTTSLLPDVKTVYRCQDKLVTAKLLRESGVSVPDFACGRGREEALRAVDELLISHEKVWVRARNGAGSRASLPCSHAVQAINWMSWWVEEKGLLWADLMASAFLPGEEYAWQSLWVDGEIITSAARIREQYLFGNLSPSGQSSSPSVAATVHCSLVNTTAEAAVLAVDPKATGVFCVDLKADGRGSVFVTEINAGRFFTTSNFFASLGANMPLEYVARAFDSTAGPLPKRNAVPAGARWIRIMDQRPGLYDA
jgi:hypothetical protein